MYPPARIASQTAPRPARRQRCGNPKSRHNARGKLTTHAYDGLDRLKETRQGNPVTTTVTFGHDLSGNRSGKTVNGQTTTYATQTASNRLSSLAGAEAKSFAHDAAGNLIQDGTASYTYDNAGRRIGATVAGQSWQYAYNALGQRVKRSGSTIHHYAYDERGQLLGVYDGVGQPLQEIVWLDDLPVATLRGGAIYYIHADHLGTPRRITRPADNTVMWQWESEPFGYSPPNENPQGQGTFTFNLRFPGQFRDAETGLFYNYFRDYDPQTGRYVQSDPIGLEGGINTYTYVNGNPLRYIDPRGLTQQDIDNMLELVNVTQPDLNVPSSVSTYEGGVSGAGVTWPFPGRPVSISDRETLNKPSRFALTVTK